MNTSKLLRKIDIFISSPSDQVGERQAAVRVIGRLNRMQHIASHYVLKPLTYEDLVPGLVGDKPQTVVDKYMMEASKADLFICSLWSRMGTPVIDEVTGEHFQSGTEYEFISAYRANQRTGKPHILLYRNMKPSLPTTDTEQLLRVQTFFSHFEGEDAEFKGLYRKYQSVEEFEEILFQDLDTVLAKDIIESSSVTGVQQASQPLRTDFFQHVPLPPNYISRPEVLNDIRTMLVSGASAVLDTPPIALHGMGGIGKSVVARALCDDQAIRNAYPDGFLWATLGQTPNILASLREWIYALGGAITEQNTTEDSLRGILAGLLVDRAVLLIVDDVWQKKHAEVFRVGGQRCRLVVTTRDAEVARSLGAKIYVIHTMTHAEALHLLEKWADGGLADSDPTLTAQIVDRLGRLPLALKLAGPQLQRKSPQDWIATFDARKLKARRQEDVHDSLEQTFNLSLDALQKSERHLYAALAIFPADEAISEAAITRLWQALSNLDASETVDLVDDLAARALLEVAQASYPRAVILHDLLRDFVTAELGDAQQQAHQALLAVYGQTRRGKGWHTAPDDGYLYRHLVYHLMALADYDAVHNLFSDPSWMYARVIQDGYQYDGYLIDLDNAWQLAARTVRQQIEKAEAPVMLARTVRYTLIRASINAVAGNHIPAVVARAVETALWDASRALSFASKVPDPQEKTLFLATLLKSQQLNEAQKEQAQHLALLTMQVMKDPQMQSRSLASFAFLLSGEHFRTALSLSMALVDGYDRVWALTAFLPILSGELRQEVLETAFETALRLERRGGLALALIAPYLTDNMLPVALEKGLVLPNEGERTHFLVEIVRQLNDSLLVRVRQAANSIESSQERAKLLIALIPRCSISERAAMIDQALGTISQISTMKDTAAALNLLIPYLSEAQRLPVLQQAVETMLAYQGKWGRADAIVALAPHLSTEMIEIVFAATLELAQESVFGGSPFAKALAALLPRLSETMVQQAFNTAQCIEGEVGRVEALAVILSRLSSSERQLATQEALATALSLGRDVGRKQAVLALLPFLDGTLLEEVLEASLTIEDQDEQVNALVSLLPAVSESECQSILGRSLSAALQIHSEDTQAVAFAVLGPYLQDDLLRSAAETAFNMKLEVPRAEAISNLAANLKDDLREKALAISSTIGDEELQISVKFALTKNLGEANREVLLQALELASKLDRDWQRSSLLTKLAPYLKGVLLDQAVELALGIQDESRRADALTALVPWLGDDRLEFALHHALQLQDPIFRAHLLAILIPRLPPSLKEQAVQVGVETAQSLPVEGSSLAPSRASMLAQFGSSLDKNRVGDALTEAFRIDRALERAKAMASLVALVNDFNVALDKTMLFKELLNALLNHLHELCTEKRRNVLEFCAEQTLWQQVGLPQEIMLAIAQHIIEICQDWQWI